MEQLRTMLKGFYDTQNKFSNSEDHQYIFSYLQCEVIKSVYTILSPNSNKNKIMLENLDSLGIDYHKPRFNNQKTLALIDVLVDNIDSNNSSESAMNILQDNFVIIRNENLRDFLDGLRVMNKLQGVRNTPPYSQITTYSSSKKTSSRLNYLRLLKFIDYIIKKHNDRITVTYSSLTTNSMRISFDKMFDSQRLIGVQTSRQSSEIIKEIKLQQKEEIKKISIFKDNKITQLNIRTFYFKQSVIQELIQRKVVTKKKQMFSNFNDYSLGKYKVFSAEGCHGKLSAVVKVSLVDLHEFIVRSMKEGS